jgi:outer membrane protein OmpA-like peptidoglycan-associated protein
MSFLPKRLSPVVRAGLLLAAAPGTSVSLADEMPRADLLNFASGAVPVAIEDAEQPTKVGMDQALRAIDGDGGGFGLTPKPGNAQTRVAFVYELPALTTFEGFAVPGVLETPSPFQTFVRKVVVSGSDAGPEGPFVQLAETELETHAGKGESTAFPASLQKPVRWVRIELGGGINIEREKTFLEFSEIIGYGSQEPVALVEAFTGKWKGRGVKVELKQDGVRVDGCYDADGELSGTVSGNLLHATGKTGKGGIPSAFVLSVSPEGQLFGVRSTNGAPFRLYAGNPADKLRTPCSTQEVEQVGCGSVLHGIRFDFDSAVIRPESGEHLDALYEGLQATSDNRVTVIGHTSSEGSATYNRDLAQRRADAVAAALVSRGIDSARVAAEGRGEEEPIADNATEVGRSLNRRVEIACN